MTDIKKIIAVYTGGAVLVILLVAAIIMSTQKDTADVGLFRPDETVEPSAETQQNREDEYDNREEIPDVIAGTLAQVVATNLSSGDFDNLDAKLEVWAGIYKENQDDALAIMDEISSYRADIAYIKLLPDATPQTTWQFYNPDFLAAAVAYLPISVKYQAMISHDSAVMAPALSDIELKEAEKSPQELRTILDTINQTRTTGNEFQRVAVYEMTVFGYDCEFIAVSETSGVQWQPYSLTVKNDHNFSITAALCYDLLASNPDTNLDATLAFLN